MAQRKKYWIKLWLKTLDDERVGTLPKDARLAFYEYLLIAGRNSPDEGILPPAREIAWITRESEEYVREQLAQLHAANLLSRLGDLFVLLTWDKHQGQSAHAKRQQRYRDRERQKELERDQSIDKIELLRDHLMVGSSLENKEEEKTRVISSNSIQSTERDVTRDVTRDAFLPKTDEDAILKVMDLESFWVDTTGGSLPRKMEFRISEYFTPLNNLLIRVDWDIERAKALLVEARNTMIADGFPPRKASAVVPKILADLEHDKVEEERGKADQEWLADFQSKIFQSSNS